ncbi:MAG TPA: DUF5929 domain-containing protein [Gillisia sp.]|nr:DUF5929 domain-containing protein [Gillisia sp.]
MPKNFGIELKDVNSRIVASIENHAHNNIELTLDGVFHFMRKRKDFHPKYKVFKEYFVVCWAGKTKKIKGETYYSRLDIELINEQVKLFYSELDVVSISIDKDNFKIIEYVHLGLQDKFQYYPLEEVNISFKDNAGYDMDSKLLFEPPQFDKKILYHIYNSNNAIISKLKNGTRLNKNEEKDLLKLPASYLICYFNDFEASIDKLEEAKDYLKLHSKKAYQSYKDSVRILRKVKYN